MLKPREFEFVNIKNKDRLVIKWQDIVVGKWVRRGMKGRVVQVLRRRSWGEDGRRFVDTYYLIHWADGKESMVRYEKVEKAEG